MVKISVTSKQMVRDKELINSLNSSNTCFVSSLFRAKQQQ